ncbi:hypothetical protein FIBSPDRAFT_250299 [Athelia psychrophila]|uniref:Uncharacterized protein n=1 Tax=Athelia psychrophila TaxID=1759441 RepID=A0A165XX25_9AGAM|nr:hypothetical protein FIBSPDRAFT_250299 [Fibularhizoctonia sp. CBS 109695]
MVLSSRHRAIRPFGWCQRVHPAGDPRHAEAGGVLCMFSRCWCSRSGRGVVGLVWSRVGAGRRACCLSSSYHHYDAKENKSKNYKKEQQRKPRHKREKEKDGPRPNNPSNGRCTRSWSPTPSFPRTTTPPPSHTPPCTPPWGKPPSRTGSWCRSTFYSAYSAWSSRSICTRQKVEEVFYVRRPFSTRAVATTMALGMQVLRPVFSVTQVQLGLGPGSGSSSAIAPVTGTLPMLINAEVWTMRSKTPLLLHRSKPERSTLSL